MVYLRGTVNNLQKKRERYTPGPVSLSNKVARLQRQVAHITPALNYFIRTETPTSDAVSSFSYQTALINPTGEYVGSTQFRNEITGDTFYNKKLKVIWTGGPDNKIQAMRMVVYSPKLADTVFKPANTKQGFVTIPDPAAFNVYFDEVFQDYESLAPFNWSREIPLRNKLTEYNGSTLERGPIRISLMYLNESDNEAGTLGFQLVTQDK